MLIAYSTAQGLTASDVGDGAGPFASALAERNKKARCRGNHDVPKCAIKGAAVYRAKSMACLWHTTAILFFKAESERSAQETSDSKPASTHHMLTDKPNSHSGMPSKTVRIRPFCKRMSNSIQRVRLLRLARLLVSRLQKSAEKETLALIKKEELRAAEEKKRQAEAERLRAKRQVESAKQAEDLRKARAELKKARDAARLAEQQRAEALKAVEEARQQKERSKHRTDDAAKTQVASLPAEKKPGQAPQPTIDYTRDVQRALKNLGCYTGAVDGDWGPGSKRALVKAIGPQGRDLLPSLQLTTRLMKLKDGICAKTTSKDSRKGRESRKSPNTKQATTPNTTSFRKRKPIDTECRDWKQCAANNYSGHVLMYCGAPPTGCK